LVTVRHFVAAIIKPFFNRERLFVRAPGIRQDVAVLRFAADMRIAGILLKVARESCRKMLGKTPSYRRSGVLA
jgi:hypothetical protein